MDKNFLNWYTRKYEEISEEPPLEAWNNIARSLDNKDKSGKRRVIPFSIVLAGMILISSILYFGSHIFEWKGKMPEKRQITKQSHSHMKRIVTKQKQEGYSEAGKQNSSLQREKLFCRGGSTKAASHGPSTVTIHKRIFAADQNNFQKAQQASEASTTRSLEAFIEVNQLLNIPAREQKLDGLPANADSINASLSDVTLDTGKIIVKGRRFLLGLIAFYSNPWIINANLFDGTNSNSLSYVKISFNTSAAVQMGYKLKHRKALWAELSSVNSIRQEYFSFSEGHLRKCDINLNYVHLNSYVSFNSEEGLGRRSLKTYFSFLAGLQSGYLTSAQQVIANKGSSDEYDTYRKMNLALLAGGVYTVNWKERYNFAFSLRGNVGVVNVYKGSDEVPRDLNKTHVVNVSTALNFFYNF